MNPAYPPQTCPPEAYPLHGKREDTFPGQLEARTTVQHTTVNMPAEPPRDHIIWSLWCFTYGNICCLGLVALIFSIKARDRKMLGDVDGARHYGNTARCVNIVATVLVALLLIISIVSYSVIIAKIHSVSRSIYNFEG